MTLTNRLFGGKLVVLTWATPLQLNISNEISRVPLKGGLTGEIHQHLLDIGSSKVPSLSVRHFIVCAVHHVATRATFLAEKVHGDMEWGVFRGLSGRVTQKKSL